ncbi:hypothetical protein ACWGDT_00620 [Streptomyces avermitilis]
MPIVHPATPGRTRPRLRPACTAKLRAARVPVTCGRYPAMLHGFLGLAEPLAELLADPLADARVAQRSIAEVVASTVSGRKKSGEGGGGAG